MPGASQGSFRLFTIAGIDVFLHWSWFLAAIYEIKTSQGHYSSPLWNVAEYLALFLIVTVHEFGHALACRQAGGQANRIVLWPLGGVAYVNPPPRPGATLWSIAAGPLVNVALVFVLGLMVLGARVVGDFYGTDIYAFMQAVFLINLVLLVFNILPIYPLDGGQILRSLLWFIIGPIRSLMAVAIIGFIGAAALILFALFAQSVWIGAVAVFILLNCWGGLQQALMLARVAKAPPPLTDVPPDQLNITQ